MADKKKDERVYCSVILTNGMEYMVRAIPEWSVDSGDVFTAQTMDGNPTQFMGHSIVMIRQVSETEFKAWQASLEAYREQKLKEQEAADKLKV